MENARRKSRSFEKGRASIPNEERKERENMRQLREKYHLDGHLLRHSSPRTDIEEVRRAAGTGVPMTAIKEEEITKAAAHRRGAGHKAQSSARKKAPSPRWRGPSAASRADSSPQAVRSGSFLFPRFPPASGKKPKKSRAASSPHFCSASEEIAHPL